MGQKEYCERKFQVDLKELCSLSKNASEPWILREDPSRASRRFAEQRSTQRLLLRKKFPLTRDSNEKAEVLPMHLDCVRCCTICYSDAYKVPSLWFNFYRFDGRLLLIEELEPFGFPPSDSFLGDTFTQLADDKSPIGKNLLLMEAISQNEHPHLGIAFYNFHPCRTADLLCPLRPRNYVLSFLSLMNPILGFTLLVSDSFAVAFNSSANIDDEPQDI